MSIDIVIERVRGVYGGWRRDTPVSTMRTDWDALFASSDVDIDVKPDCVGGADAVWVCSRNARYDRVLLYFHGGGYKLGSTRSHQDLMARISAAAECRVVGINYRLAPEYPYPSALHDAIAAYDGLLASGISHDTVAVAGDSAGGGLAAALLLSIRARGAPMPLAAVMLSPWMDLTAQSDSYQTRAALDPIHQRAMILATAHTYLGEHGNPTDPYVSPLFGELHDLPPMLLQVGNRETVLDDSTRFAQKARAAGVEVRLQIYDNMIHVFQQFAKILPDGRDAIECIGQFLNNAWMRTTQKR